MTNWAGAGALGVWHGVAAGQEEAVEDWYNNEHHAERLAVPGFLRARRYVNLGRGPRYFSRYDVAEVGVLASAPYLAALNAPSPWSQRMFPHYRNTMRGAFEVRARRGIADGGVVATLRFASDPFAADADPACAALLDALANAHGVLRAEAWRADLATTAAPTMEKTLRTGADACPAWALVIDGSSAEALRAALDPVIPEPMRATAEIDLLQLAFNAVAA
jgi:hypothetical protein